MFSRYVHRCALKLPCTGSSSIDLQTLEQLLNIGWGTLSQAFPAWFCAVLIDVHSKPLIIGLVVGVGVTIWTEFMIEDSIAEIGVQDPYTHSVHWFSSYFWGLLANVVTLFVAETMCRSKHPNTHHLDHQVLHFMLRCWYSPRHQ